MSNGNPPMTTIALEQVLPPLESTIERSLEVLCYEEGKNKEKEN